MKNRQHIWGAALLLILLNACYSDKGNYDYAANEEIETSGLKSNYTVESGLDVLSIPMSVKSNKAGELQYLWIIQDYQGSTLFSKPDTIARTKDLNVKINKTPKTYSLIFKVKNQSTGYEKISNVILNVNTLYTQGWYVMKDIDQGADIDFFSLKTSDSYLPNPDRMVNNVIETVNGVKMRGTARQIRFIYNFGLQNALGVFEATKTIMATSEHDIIVSRINNMQIQRDNTNIGYGAMTTITPDIIYNASVFILFVNNGNLHTISTGLENTGHFGESFILNPGNTPYKLSKYMVYDRDGIMFDELSSSFVNIDYYGGLSYYRDAATTQVKSRNNNLECLFMNRRNRRRSSRLQADGYGVFKDKTTGLRSLIYFTSAKMPTAFNVTSTPIADAEVAAHATLFTLSADEAYMYMVSKQGDIYSRNLNNSQEELEFDVPSDETVTYIRHHKIEAADEYPGQEFNLISVATTKLQNGKATYKIRFFDKNAGRMILKPELVLEGIGVAKDLTYVYADYDSTWAIN